MHIDPGCLQEEPSSAAGSASSAESGGTVLSPWQAELKAKKKQPPKLPKPVAKAKPPVTGERIMDRSSG